MPALKYVKTAQETQNVYKFGKTFIHIQTLNKRAQRALDRSPESEDF